MRERVRFVSLGSGRVRVEEKVGMVQDSFVTSSARAEQMKVELIGEGFTPTVESEAPFGVVFERDG